MFSCPTSLTAKSIVRNGVNSIASEIEKKLNADLCWYCGGINDVFIQKLPSAIESLALNKDRHDKLAFVLTTTGGSIEIAEHAVDVIRHFYDIVYFIVPDMAMSAGTIICLSGDEIFMRYTACLGPIDTQVWTGDQYISASAYLEKIEELIRKSRSGAGPYGGISHAEMNLLLQQDLGRIASYEQAANLAKDLACKWLVAYKFKNWVEHERRSGHPLVTQKEKEDRAEEIVNLLSNNVFWHSHARRISMETLKRDLRLKILDISSDSELDNRLCSYHSVLRDFITTQNVTDYFHNKCYF